MKYKKLMRTYLLLLFNSVALTILCAYVYIFHFYNLIMLLGFTCSINTIWVSIDLIIAAYKDNKRKT